MDLKGCDEEDRMNFVKKVYVILFVSLAITAGFTAIGITSRDMASWMQDDANIWLYIVLLIVMIIVEIVMICVRSVARSVPINYIMLLIFVLCESYFVCWLCQYYTYDPRKDDFADDGYRTVGAAGAMTLAIVAAATTYAWTTKTDFTMKAGFIWIFGMTFFMLSIFSIFFYSYFFQMFMCALGTLLFGIYLIFDTQLILGQGRYSLSIDDYILGALVLYIDIIMIFIYILQLCGGR